MTVAIKALKAGEHRETKTYQDYTQRDDTKY